MAAYRRDYDSSRLTAKNRDQVRNPTLGNRVWATFTFFNILPIMSHVSWSGWTALWRVDGNCHWLSL